jgi:hypothetical protein
MNVFVEIDVLEVEAKHGGLKRKRRKPKWELNQVF